MRDRVGSCGAHSGRRPGYSEREHGNGYDQKTCSDVHLFLPRWSLAPEQQRQRHGLQLTRLSRGGRPRSPQSRKSGSPVARCRPLGRPLLGRHVSAPHAMDRNTPPRESCLRHFRPERARTSSERDELASVWWTMAPHRRRAPSTPLGRHLLGYPGQLVEIEAIARSVRCKARAWSRVGGSVPGRASHGAG